MSDTIEQPKPGRPRKELAGDIVTLLKETDNRAMTLGEITAEVDGARRTVKDRLDKLTDRDTTTEYHGRICSQQIGNATAYWYQEPQTSGGISQQWLTATFLDLGEDAAPWGGRFGWAFVGLLALTVLANVTGYSILVWGPLAGLTIVFFVIFVLIAAFAWRYSPKMHQIKQRFGV